MVDKEEDLGSDLGGTTGKLGREMRPEEAAERGLGDMPCRVHSVTSLGSSRSPCIALPVSTGS